MIIEIQDIIRNKSMIKIQNPNLNFESPEKFRGKLETQMINSLIKEKDQNLLFKL